MNARKMFVAVVLLFYGGAIVADEVISLKGSPTSIESQFNYARERSLVFMPNAQAIAFFLAGGMLVELRENADIKLVDVSYPYVLPDTLLFVEWLAGQYRSACGEELVVTSAIRPMDGQPVNAHPLSVHPTGMTVDLRRSRNRQCRLWLEETLLSLEGVSVVDGTRERKPPHYHVAVLTEQYQRYVVAKIELAKNRQ